MRILTSFQYHKLKWQSYVNVEFDEFVVCFCAQCFKRHINRNNEDQYKLFERKTVTTSTYKRVGRSDLPLFPLNLWPLPRSTPEKGKSLRRWHWDYQRCLIFGIFGIIKDIWLLGYLGLSKIFDNWDIWDYQRYFIIEIFGSIKDGQALPPDDWVLWDPREDRARREDLLKFALVPLNHC